MKKEKKDFIQFLQKNEIEFSMNKDVIVFNNQGSVDLRSLTALPEGIQFNNQGSVYLGSLTAWDMENCGSSRRNIYIVNQKGILKVKLGCFWGTKEEAIKAIEEKYRKEQGDEYIIKIKLAFDKGKERYKITA